MELSEIKMIDRREIISNTNYLELIHLIKKGFQESTIIVPHRHHYSINMRAEDQHDTILSMPVWEDNRDLGIKFITVHPDNPTNDLPTVQGVFILTDAQNGKVVSILDASALTVKPTAATSALASSLLSRQDSKCLLMIGTGALSTELIQAHRAVRPIKKVYVWGRNEAKARQVCDTIDDIDCVVCDLDEHVIGEADIISTATMSFDPLFHGSYVSEGTHIDLVGSYKKNMREVDDDVIRRSKIFVDTAAASLQSGDLVIPMSNGVIQKEDIIGDLFDLCQSKVEGRHSDIEITLFKSVGYALEDLIAARYYYNKTKNGS